jgi:hypothetical protein
MKSPVQFLIRSGDDFGRTLTWTTSSPVVPVDLTNASIEFSIRGGTVSWQFVDDEHVGATDAEAGKFFIALSASETRSLRSSGTSTFRFEVTVEFSPEQRRTVLFGTLALSAEAIV